MPIAYAKRTIDVRIPYVKTNKSAFCFNLTDCVRKPSAVRFPYDGALAYNRARQRTEQPSQANLEKKIRQNLPRYQPEASMMQSGIFS